MHLTLYLLLVIFGLLKQTHAKGDSVALSKRAVHIANWWHSFDRMGWSHCHNNRYMTGLWRNSRPKKRWWSRPHDGIYRIEEVECRDPPSRLMSSRGHHCVNGNWWRSFDHRGWSKCPRGYYMEGLYRTSGNSLSNIEEAHCCRPRKQIKAWGRCYDQDVSRSLDYRGWSKCRHGHYMVGLWRNNCNELFCIEKFRCCRMGRSLG